MRTALLVLVLFPVLALAAGKPEVYKWVDDKGVVHYTDKPPTEGATPAKLPPLQTYKGGTNPNLNKYDKPAAGKTAQPITATAQVQIVTPSADETFRISTVPVAVMVTPALVEGQKLIYLLDGVPQATPTTSTSYSLTGVERGSHSVSATVIDESGQQIGQAAPVTFNVLLASAIPRGDNFAPTAPGVPRKPPPKKSP